MTEGRKLTDKELEKLEKKLAKEYKTAKKEMQKKLDKFKKRFDAADKAQRGLLDKGVITKKQYEEWRLGQIARSQWMQDQIKSYADDLVHVNQRAAEAINKTLPTVFAESHNFGTYETEKAARIGTNYTLYNRDTVARLLRDDPKLLPKASIDIPKDKKWNVQKMNSALTQGIMQGESVDKISRRLQNVTDMNRASAVRNARTMVTGAENAGKLESYRRAAAMGIKLKKMWSATMDDRTRDSHAFLDAVTVPLEEEFPNGCMYPGDPGGPGDEVWNCRCELSMQLDGFERDMTDLSNRNTDHFNYDSYEQWKDAKQKAKMVELPKVQSPSETQYKRVFNNADAYKCKNFDEYARYVKTEFGATFDDSMRALNLDLVKDGTAGVETVLRDVSAINPNAVQELKLTIKEEAGGFMGTIPKQDMTMHLTFNGEVYKDKTTILEYIKSGIDNGTFLEGTSPSTLGAHEAGHLIEWILDKTQQDAHYAWRSCDVARDIVDEARKSVRNELERRRKAGASWDELILLEEKFNNVSKYASYSASEKMAEAFHDVYALRKSDASFFNKEVVRISLERLQQVL